MSYRFADAQQALSFFTQQASVIEAAVYRIKYPDVQYPSLIPVDSSANEWAKSVTFFSIDKTGAADWFHHSAHDMRMADIQRTKAEKNIEMAGIGYRYTLEELGQAMLIPGFQLTTERAESARRAYEEFIDRIAFFGDTAKGWTGLVNDATATRSDAIADGTGSSRLWSTKTGDQICATSTRNSPAFIPARSRWKWRTRSCFRWIATRCWPTCGLVTRISTASNG
jgi:hypothetical protein